MVHQHFMLIPVMTVAENVVLGTEPVRSGVILDEPAAEKRVGDMARTLHFAVDPKALVEDISVGQQQRVEIMKALYRNADLLILDEPTAALTPQEASDLFEILRTLRREGISIIFISHKLNEVLDIADRITVLRRGKAIETVPRKGATEASLARAMVGRDVLLRVEKEVGQPGDVLLTVEDLHVRDDREIEKVRGVSFDVRAGEIVGIAGVDGNGQTELIDALTGLQRIESGKVSIAGATSPARRRQDGARLRNRTHPGGSPAARARARVLDRREHCAARLREPAGRARRLALPTPDGRAGPNPDPRVRRAGGGPYTRAGGLSGGNQQKVVVAREIDRDPKVLIAAQPTRGLDVGAIEYLHRRLVTERDEGRAILLVSLELDEILSLSDRILVMYEGEIVGEHTGEVSEEAIGLEMLGGREAEAA